MSTMSKDLVEVVARALYEASPYHLTPWADANPLTQDDFRDRAELAISAINASGIAKVAPVVATEAMCDAGGEWGQPDNIWSAMISAVEG